MEFFASFELYNLMEFSFEIYTILNNECWLELSGLLLFIDFNSDQYNTLTLPIHYINAFNSIQYSVVITPGGMSYRYNIDQDRYIYILYFYYIISLDDIIIYI